MDRVVGLERLGVKDYLPDLEGRTIYLAYHESVSGNIRDLMERIEKNARKVETIFRGDGLEIRKYS